MINSHTTYSLSIDKRYIGLFEILISAYEQAADGKGAQRHGSGLAFEDQPMQTISDILRSPHGMSFQAIKKIREGLELPTHEAQVRELLGAINYVAGLVLYLQRTRPAPAPETLGELLRQRLQATDPTTEADPYFRARVEGRRIDKNGVIQDSSDI